MTEIEWEPVVFEPLPDDELEQRFSQATGRPGGLMRFFAGSEVCAEVVISLSVELNAHVYVDHDLADYIGLVVGQDNSCRFCFGATRALLRILGLPESRIRQIEVDLHTADLPELDRAALAFARKLSRANPMPDASDLERLRAAGYRDVEIAELTGVIVAHLFFNRLSTLCALPPKPFESLPDRWYVRFFRPVVKFRLRRMRRDVVAVALAPGAAEGPFAEQVRACDGLPLALALRRLIDLVFMPRELTPRCVALVFAVVARALGCEVSEREAVRLATAEGMSPEQVEQTLKHLACDALDDAERLLVPLARETVWYRPAQIQRRTREVLDVLSREQVLEFIAAASLANSICRLGILCDADG